METESGAPTIARLIHKKYAGFFPAQAPRMVDILVRRPYSNGLAEASDCV